MKHLRNLLILVILCSFANASFGQEEDLTKKYRKRDLEQLEQYEDGEYPFPPKPKSNWAVGVKGGLALLFGDVRPETGWGVAADVRKGIGHSFSLRFQAAIGRTYGQSFKENSGYQNHRDNPWNTLYFVDEGRPNTATNVFYNFQMTYGDASLQALFNINNINFYKEKTNWSLYGGVGIGVMGYNTYVNALDANDSIYNFTSVERIDLNDTSTPGIDGRTSRLQELNSILDDTYESPAEAHLDRRSIGFGGEIYTLNFSAVAVAGLRYRLSRRIEMELEYRLIGATDDLLDGQRWQETGGGNGRDRLTPSTTDWDAFSNLTLGIHFRIGKGEEAPWWNNPVTSLANDALEAKQAVDQLKKDTDGDNIPDIFDQEPDTPPGVPVDATGTALDSDRDGYTDDIDQERFSPNGCDVDQNGVALDSDNDRVPDCFDKEPNSPPGRYYDVNGVAIEFDIPQVEQPCLLPIIHFELNKSVIRPEFYPEMYYVAQIMRNDPNVKVKAVGYADVRNSDEYNEKLSKDRVENAISFLVNTYGIDETRFLKDYRGEKDPVIKGLPENGGDQKLEPLYYVNRRVEFECVRAER